VRGNSIRFPRESTSCVHCSKHCPLNSQTAMYRRVSENSELLLQDMAQNYENKSKISSCRFGSYIFIHSVSVWPVAMPQCTAVTQREIYGPSMRSMRKGIYIGVDPARVRGSGPSWNFASEGPPLFGPSQNFTESSHVWSTVMKHSEHSLCQYHFQSKVSIARRALSSHV